MGIFTPRPKKAGKKKNMGGDDGEDMGATMGDIKDEWKHDPEGPPCRGDAEKGTACTEDCFCVTGYCKDAPPIKSVTPIERTRAAHRTSVNYRVWTDTNVPGAKPGDTTERHLWQHGSKPDSDSGSGSGSGRSGRGYSWADGVFDRIKRKPGSPHHFLMMMLQLHARQRQRRTQQRHGSKHLSTRLGARVRRGGAQGGLGVALGLGSSEGGGLNGDDGLNDDSGSGSGDAESESGKGGGVWKPGSGQEPPRICGGERKLHVVDGEKCHRKWQCKSNMCLVGRNKFPSSQVGDSSEGHASICGDTREMGSEPYRSKAHLARARGKELSGAEAAALAAEKKNGGGDGDGVDIGGGGSKVAPAAPAAPAADDEGTSNEGDGLNR